MEASLPSNLAACRDLPQPPVLSSAERARRGGRIPVRSGRASKRRRRGRHDADVSSRARCSASCTSGLTPYEPPRAHHGVCGVEPRPPVGAVPHPVHQPSRVLPRFKEVWIGRALPARKIGRGWPCKTHAPNIGTGAHTSPNRSPPITVPPPPQVECVRPAVAHLVAGPVQRHTASMSAAMSSHRGVSRTCASAATRNPT